ncbi:MAG: hypothetical protein A2V66_08835 [Ignavibacteria bacterium RBG_13_36_8]|nr:MAG: hypothetical protein A2V66_08835 [Ignavibacteria bacterium RBG_13_36_8]
MSETYDEKKLCIIKASMKAFAKFGYHKTTLEDIAEMVGIKKNSLYYYFPNKESLFHEMVLSEADTYFTEQMRILDTTLSSAEKVKRFMENAVRLHRDMKILHSIKEITLIEISEAAKTLLHEFKRREIDLLDSILKEGIKNKEFAKHNSIELAEELLNISRALEYRIYHSSRAKFLHEIDFGSIDKTTTIIVNLIVKGLR